MNSKYKLILSNNNFHKEIEILDETEIFTIGTDINCDYRIAKSLFFEDIEVILSKVNGNWMISCADNLYFSEGDLRKLMIMKLSHGTILELKYQNTDSSVFSIEFIIDFEGYNKIFDREINISNKDKLYIGKDTSCDICLKSEYIKNDLIEILKKIINYRLMLRQVHMGCM